MSKAACSTTAVGPLTGLVFCMQKLLMPHEFCFCLLLNPNLHFFSVSLQNITVLVYPAENVKEVENITVTYSTCTLRDGPGKSPSGEIILPSVNGNFILCSVTKNYISAYILRIFSEVGTTLQRMRELL